MDGDGPAAGRVDRGIAPMLLAVLVLAAPLLLAPAAPEGAVGSDQVARDVQPVVPGVATARGLVSGLRDTTSGWRIGPIRPAGDTVLVGARAVPGDGAVQVRARRNGRWSPWTGLVRDTAHGPDPDLGLGRAATIRPVWVGPVDDLQVRVRGGTGALRLALVGVPRSLGELLPGGSGSRLPPDLPRLPSLPDLGDLLGGDEEDTGTPDGSVARPRILPRSAWGPRRAVPSHDPPPPRYAEGVRHVVIHHTASVWDGAPCERADDMIRAFYRYHVEVNGWTDLGYNFVVDPCGRIWEGRDGGPARPVVGAHAGGWNRGSTGIALIGDYAGRDRVSRAGIDAVDRLVAWKTDLHDIDPRTTTTETSRGGSARTPAGRRATFPTIHGHGRTNHTTCPGDRLRAWVDGHGRPSMADRVAARHRAARSGGG